MNFALVIIFLASLLFNGNEPVTIKKYKTKGGLWELELGNDSFFYLEYFFGIHLKRTRGKWERIDKKTILLSSSIKNLNEIPITVEESLLLEKPDSLSFEIISGLKIGSQITLDLILDDTIQIHSTKNLICIPIVEFSSIQIRANDNCENCSPVSLQDEFSSEVCRVKNNQSNSFKINWDVTGEMFNYEVIENDTFVLKGRKIYWPAQNQTFYRQRSP